MTAINIGSLIGSMQHQEIPLPMLVTLDYIKEINNYTPKDIQKEQEKKLF